MAIDDHFEELAAGLIGDDTESDNPVEAELTEEFRNVLDEIEPAPLVALRSALTIAMEAIDELIEEQAHVEDEVIFRELLDRSPFHFDRILFHIVRSPPKSRRPYAQQREELVR